MSMDKWVASKSTQLSANVWVKLLLLLENALNLNFEALKVWTHTHSDPTINKHTEQVTKLHRYMDLSWYALNSMILVKNLYHTEKQGFGYPWPSKKNSRHTHQNSLKLSPVSERSAYALQNYVCFSPLTSGLESFGHRSRPWIETYCPKF